MSIFKKLLLAFVAISIGAAVALLATPTAIVNPRSFHCVWNPGDYSNFVVLSSTDLVNWQTYLITTETNFQFYATDPQRFFALYGTNADGDSAWAGAQP